MAFLLSAPALVPCKTYQQGITSSKVGGLLSVTSRTMGASTLQHHLHCGGAGIRSDTRPAHVWRQQCKVANVSRLLERAQHSSRGADLRPWTTTIILLLLLLFLPRRCHPASGLLHGQSMWESGGNSFDLLHPDPLGSGVKQNMGQ